MTKICSKCFCEQPLSEFRLIKSGSEAGNYRSECRTCRNTFKRNYYALNREKHAKWNRRYRTKNPEKKLMWDRRSRAADPERGRNAWHKWRKNNLLAARKKRKDYEKGRRDGDGNYKLLCNLRCRITGALKGGTKSARTLALLGCDIPTLWARLEALFQPGMTRDNHGKGPGKWNVDHIRPIASFSDLTDLEQQKQCFHYTNLQPLWEPDNLRKGAKWLMVD